MKILDNLYGMVKQEWSKQEVLDEIDKIQNSFDLRVCENCKYYIENGCGNIIEHCIFPMVKDFGCNRFEKKK